MKWISCCLGFIFVSQLSSFAQQRLRPGDMNYITNPKPNSIIYHDTLFKGSVQFQELFYRNRNTELIRLYKKHQSNKITGQVMSVIGTLVSVIGISVLSSSEANKGLGWALLGGGFAASITGGYLTLMGQRNLQMAVVLFNQQNHKAALGMGISGSSTGLVYKF